VNIQAKITQNPPSPRERVSWENNWNDIWCWEWHMQNETKPNLKSIHQNETYLVTYQINQNRTQK
jgi:hypothetical protein